MRKFEDIVLPHLDAAYNLARWLTGNEHDAQDVVQESYLRALRAFDGFRPGSDARPWLLKIVRNTCYTWLRKNRGSEAETLTDAIMDSAAADCIDVETKLILEANTQLLREALTSLPLQYREPLILRELEGLSYKAIAELTEVPIGTVMSRLSRGRQELSARIQQSARGVKA